MASLYTARQPDGQGRIHYTDEEHGTWRILIARQLAALDGKACDEYQAGLARLDLPLDRIPQLGEINAALMPATGWSVAAVPAWYSSQALPSSAASWRAIRIRQVPCSSSV
jgi:phenylalanine-4-hydroxylase